MSLADVVLEGNKWHILKPAGLRVDCFKTEYLFLKNKNQVKPVKSHPYIYFLLVLQLSLLPGMDKSQSFASKRFKKVFTDNITSPQPSRFSPLTSFAESGAAKQVQNISCGRYHPNITFLNTHRNRDPSEMKIT